MAEIRVLIFREEETWVAQGLERDICVQAPALDDLQARFQLALRLEGNEPGGIERIGKAPDFFFAQWDSVSMSASPMTGDIKGVTFGIAA